MLKGIIYMSAKDLGIQTLDFFFATPTPPFPQQGAYDSLIVHLETLGILIHCIWEDGKERTTQTSGQCY